MEFKLLQPTSTDAFTPILFNHEELKKELTESLKKYEGLVYTEDTVKTAKTDRAKLNKFKDAIETKRKEIKKQCLKPYDDFETKVKEIVGMVDKPILAIDGQIKGFEEKQKEEKTAKICDFYTANIGELKDLLPLAMIENKQWLNVTYKLKDIEIEIADAVIKVKSNLKVITGLSSEFELQIKDTYLKTFDLSAALQEKARLEEQKTKQEEYDRIQAEKKKQRELERQQAEQQRLANVKEVETHREVIDTDYTVKTDEPEPVPVQSVTIEETVQIDFRIWATKTQLQALKQFLHDNEITYGRVK